MLLAVDIHAVVGQLLCNDLKFFHSLCHQLGHLAEYIFFLAALVFSSNERDGTIGTMTIASFADFNIGVVVRCGEEPFSLAGVVFWSF